jgi:hypothetical protein
VTHDKLELHDMKLGRIKPTLRQVRGDVRNNATTLRWGNLGAAELAQVRFVARVA